MIEAANILNRFTNLPPGRQLFRTISYSKNQANFTPVRYAKSFLHLTLIIQAKHTCGKSQIHGLIAHIESGHANITLRKSLRISVVIDHHTHYFGRLLYENNEGRHLFTRRNLNSDRSTVELVN